MSSSSEESLRTLLAAVHERLQSAEQMEAETRQSLTALMRDIEVKLGGGSASGARAQPPLPRLEALAVKFEASHPALAQTLMQLVDALGKAGI
jgi:hypothetical protein